MQIALHQRQEEIFYDETRFKVVAAGRRFGKSYLAAVTLFVEGAKTTKIRSDGVEIDLALEEIYYVAPTYVQGKKILWPLLKMMGHELIQQSYENEGMLTLINGRRISIKGADKPDSLRGIGQSYVVMDEYAFMKDEVWEQIIRPQLLRSEGGALFIGTPAGKNHFYDLYMKGMDPSKPDWKSWTFTSEDNPHLPAAEIEELTEDMSVEKYRQEIEASFEATGGVHFSADMFRIEPNSNEGDIYICCDLAGFQKYESGRKIERRDDHAISIVKVHAGGWHIKDIVYGKWDTRETALRIVKAYRDHRPVKLGIEKGMSKNAVGPYLEDEMNRLKVYFTIWDLTHGNQAKPDRIAWAMQGRAEKGRITLEPGDWNRTFIEQCIDFPSPIAHDDLIDAVSYTDQLAEPYFDGPDMIDEWEPLDEYAGY